MPKVTLDTVAALMTQGFEAQEKQHTRMEQRLDRFEDEMRAAIRERPTRDEVQAVAEAAAVKASNDVLLKYRQNGKPKSQWWDSWGKVATVLLTIAGFIGALVAGALKAQGGG